MNPVVQKKTYTVIITSDKEDGGFVGRCDELHAYSQGETYGETMENVKEAVELAAETCENVNDFNMLVMQE